MSTVIKIENLSKKYMIGYQKQSYSSLREDISSFAKNLFKTNSTKPSSQEFYALKDINLEIKDGDRVGILGHNGAGKSTLLKVLSKITEPTSGSVKIKGRIASLLEVGTGFHPELTGRENIFLNGAILGMKKNEVQKKFDEIVAFAEVEKFLDTPVKRYSSGMYMRLAFAIAAHLEPEILVVDEVLAVGDINFQKKCLRKMEDVNKDGRTILFVSHNIEAIRSICNRVVILKHGEIKIDSPDVNDAISKYAQYISADNTEWINKNNVESEWLSILNIQLLNSNFEKLNSSGCSKYDKIFLSIAFDLKKNDPSLTLGYRLLNEEGTILYWSYQTDSNPQFWPKLETGENTIITQIPTDILNSGKYIIELIGGLHFRQWLFEPGKQNPQVSLEITGKHSESPMWIHKRPGIIAPINNWTRKEL